MGLPDTPEISVTKTETLSLTLNHLEVDEIIRQWAKTIGFSHRTRLNFDFSAKGSVQVTLTETRTGG